MLFENTGTPTQPNYKGGVFLQDDSGEPFFFNAVENGGTVQGMEEQYWGYLSCVPRDVDGDGDLDIIISDCLGKVRWIENTGTRQKPVLSKNVRNFYYGSQPLVTPMAQQARRRRLERRRTTGFYSTGRPERPGDVFAVRT